MQVKKLIENLNNDYNPDDHVAVHIWCAGDVIEKAQESNVELTKDQADQIIDNVHEDIDSEIGINWDVIHTAIDNFTHGEKLVVVVQAGIVTDVYSPDSNLKVMVIDLDAKKNGSEDFVTDFGWPDTQFDDEKVKILLARGTGIKGA